MIEPDGHYHNELEDKDDDDPSSQFQAEERNIVKVVFLGESVPVVELVAEVELEEELLAVICINEAVPVDVHLVLTRQVSQSICQVL